MTKKRIVILTCLLLLGITLGYLFSNYLNERATQSYEWTSNPIIIWAMAIPSILCMVALVVIGYFIGKKYLQLTHGCYSELCGRIIQYYHRSWIYRMSPHYKSFFVLGFKKGSIKPIGIREYFQWYPYLFGDDIELEISVKYDKPYNFDDIKEMDFKYRLIAVNNNKVIDEEDSKLTVDIIDKNKLNKIIYLPLEKLLINQQYILEINPKIFNKVYKETWTKVMFFEVHSRDKIMLWVLGIILPIIGAIIWQLIRTYFGF